MKYILVEVTKTSITEIRRVLQSEKNGVIQSKKPNQQLWLVRTYKEGRNQLKTYNDKLIQKPHVQKPIPVEQFWYWDKAKKNDITKTLKLYKEEKWGKLMSHLNRIKICSTFFCCSSYIPVIKKEIEKYLEDEQL